MRGRNTKKYAQNGARVKTGVLKTCFCIGILFIAIGFEGTEGEDRRRGKEAGEEEEEEEEEEGGMMGNNIYERICKKARVITYACQSSDPGSYSDENLQRLTDSVQGVELPSSSEVKDFDSTVSSLYIEKG